MAFDLNWRVVFTIPHGLGAVLEGSPLEREDDAQGFNRWAVCLSLKRTAPSQSLLGFYKAQIETGVTAQPIGEKLSEQKPFFEMQFLQKGCHFVVGISPHLSMMACFPPKAPESASPSSLHPPCWGPRRATKHTSLHSQPTAP